MNGVAARAMQRFVTDCYGQARWQDVVRAARLPVASFELLLSYPEDYTWRIVAAAARVLGRPEADILEDLGTYLVAHPNTAAIRRLLRYGGADFETFLTSLDDLPDRVRLAFPALSVPTLRTRAVAPGRYEVACSGNWAGLVHVLTGAIRAMADDYGALAILDLAEGVPGAPLIAVSVPEARCFAGRDFQLGGAFG